MLFFVLKKPLQTGAQHNQPPVTSPLCIQAQATTGARAILFDHVAAIEHVKPITSTACTNIAASERVEHKHGSLPAQMHSQAQSRVA